MTNSADTKVKTAISWLERGGFLERNENANQVFQGKALFTTPESAKEKLDTLNLATKQRKYWEIILEALANTPADEGINADELAECIGAQTKDQKEKSQLRNCGYNENSCPDGRRWTGLQRPSYDRFYKTQRKKQCPPDLAKALPVGKRHACPSSGRTSG